MVASVDLVKPPDITVKHKPQLKSGPESLPTGFEGPEKILEVDFIPKQKNSMAYQYKKVGVGAASVSVSLSPRDEAESGLLTSSSDSETCGCDTTDVSIRENVSVLSVLSLRNIPRKSWDRILAEARCEILSVSSNEYFDAYVLSESSLFVYDRKVYIKTCGTTTLLRCLNLLMFEADQVGMELEWVGYSRKDFLFPTKQMYPHTSFENEVTYAKEACFGPKGDNLSGGAFVLGDIMSDHWCVYVADYCERESKTALDCNVNIMMYGLNPEVTKLFYRNKDLGRNVDVLRARKESGLDKIIGDALFDDYLFEPCGYSLNALQDEAFYTVHITPEDDFCYASFETNVEVQSYDKLVRRVVEAFRPQRFTITVFADKHGLKRVKRSPVEDRYILVGTDDTHKFIRTNRSSTCFATDYVCQMANFVIEHEVSGSRVM